MTPTPEANAAILQPGRRWLIWLIPLGGLITLAGYFGPWIDHPAAGLVVTGLDLPEYMKFLSSVRNGTLSLWRQGFYLPLVAVSLAWSLTAFRRELGYGWIVRILLLAGAAVAALNLLPPAWTPSLLRTPEFRDQTLVMLGCLGVALVSPFAALLPRQVTGALLGLLAAWSMWTPLRSFLTLLPDISQIYNAPQQPAWGPYVMLIGLGGLLAASVLLLWPRATISAHQEEEAIDHAIGHVDRPAS